MSCCEDGPGTPLKPADYAKAGFRLNPQHSKTCLLRAVSFTHHPIPSLPPWSPLLTGQMKRGVREGIRRAAFAHPPSLRWACASDTPRPPSCPGDRSDREGQGGVGGAAQGGSFPSLLDRRPQSPGELPAGGAASLPRPSRSGYSPGPAGNSLPISAGQCSPGPGRGRSALF